MEEIKSTNHFLVSLFSFTPTLNRTLTNKRKRQSHEILTHSPTNALSPINKPKALYTSIRHRQFTAEDGFNVKSICSYL